MTSAELLQEIQRRGYCHLRGAWTSEDFNRTCAELGKIVWECVVAVHEGARNYLFMRDAIPFHCDSPFVDVIGWLCAEQDDEGGESLLKDGGERFRLAEADVDALRAIRVRYPSVPDLHPAGERALLETDVRGGSIYYTPWLVVEHTVSSRARTLLGQLDDMSAGYTAIPMQRGDMLFIDNRRMLHGRHELKAGSRRQLLRAWIQVAAAGTTTTSPVQ